MSSPTKVKAVGIRERTISLSRADGPAAGIVSGVPDAADGVAGGGLEEFCEARLARLGEIRRPTPGIFRFLAFNGRAPGAAPAGGKFLRSPCAAQYDLSR